MTMQVLLKHSEDVKLDDIEVTKDFLTVFHRSNGLQVKAPCDTIPCCIVQQPYTLLMMRRNFSLQVSLEGNLRTSCRNSHMLLLFPTCQVNFLKVICVPNPAAGKRSLSGLCRVPQFTSWKPACPAI